MKTCCARATGFALLLLLDAAAIAQTTAGTSATIVFPVIAQTSSFGSEVTVYNPNPGGLTVNASFYDAQNTASPGLKPCTTLIVPAGRSVQFSVASQCALPAGSNFGLLILAEQNGTQRFYGYARTQTPSGIGFSTEGFPIENFNDQLQHATGIKRTAAAGNIPAFQTNCFVGTLGDAVDYELRLFDGTTNAQIGGTLSGSLQPYQQFRYLDVFAQAGAPAGDLTNVRAQFTNLSANNKKLIGFCTVQENTNLSADFRIAKSYGGTPQNAFVQGGNAFGVTALLGTVDNQRLNIVANNQRVMHFEPNTTSPNVIGGHANNLAYIGVEGATIAGGGAGGTSALGFICAPGFFGDCRNAVSDAFGTIGGGLANFAGDGFSGTLNSMFATVGGGWGNTASGSGSTVGGGYINEASGGVAFVAGGQANTAAGDGSTVGGGFSNFASGSKATVPGGFGNQAIGDFSFAAGYQATIPVGAYGSFLWSDSTGPVSLPANSHDVFIAVATNGIGFYTFKDYSHGCYILGAAASWTCTSDRAAKADITAIEPRDVLARLVAMPIAQWRFKGEPGTVRHIGPMAQDFRASFGLGHDDKGITGVDADGVALAAIQGLNQVVQEKDARIAVQEKRIVDLERALSNLETVVDSLTKAIK